MAKGKIKVHSLTGRITSKLVFEAWRAVRRNRGAAGIDKVSIQMFEKNLEATFLGFDIKSRFVRMRAKSVENFKTKVRQITRRSYNLDAEMIVKLNRVIRGTANYFATPWSHCGDLYRTLDRWIRMRLRCMKFERKSPKDNVRLRLKHLKRLGLLSLCDIRADRVMGSNGSP